MALAIADVNAELLAVNIADLQCQCFTEAQAHGVNGVEKDRVMGLVNGVQDSSDFILSKDIRQVTHCWWLGDEDPIPVDLEYMAPVALQAVAIEFYGAPGMCF